MREGELKKRDETDKERSATTADRMINHAEHRAWYAVHLFWILCAAIAFIGQLFVWQGADWWKSSVANMFLGAAVVFCSFVTVVLGLRWVPPGKIDLAATLQTWLVKYCVGIRLADIEPVEEKDRVRAVLEERGII